MTTNTEATKPAAKKSTDTGVSVGKRIGRDGKKAKPAKAKKTASGKPADGTKAAIAYRMLTSPKGTTRSAIVEACGGWGIDLTQFAARKNLKLRRGDEGLIFAVPKG